jgi:hypothetical protein
MALVLFWHHELVSPRLGANQLLFARKYSLHRESVSLPDVQQHDGRAG